MTSRTRSILAQAGSFILAAALLYLALRNVDLEAVLAALREADYRWLPPLIVIVLLSHVFRAWRWKVLLEALPPASPEEEPPRVSLKIAFFSLMIGYMVNYAAPRMGEVARTANLATREKLSFSGVFGTVVVERILDVVTLLMALASTFFLLLDRSAELRDLFLTPLREQFGKIPALALLGLTLAVAALVLVIYWSVARSARLSLLWNQRLQPLMTSFKDGLATLWRSRRRGALVVSTLAMWGCYLLMTHIPFYMFGMAGPYDLSLLDSWSIMNLGAVGIVIPSPGGLGSYHYIAIQTLVYLFGVERSAAATYAVFVHAAQLLLYVLAGFVSIVLQGSTLGKIRATTRAARKTRHDAAATGTHHGSDTRPSSLARHDKTPQQR